MTYTLLLLYSLIVSSAEGNVWENLKKYGVMPYMLFSLTLAIPWLIVCGSQYASGTDYFSYMDTFTTGDVGLFYNKNEFLFAKIVEIYEIRIKGDKSK